jgi:hypothetical protein
MEVYEGLYMDATPFYSQDTYGILMICLMLSSTIPLIICLFKRVNRRVNKPILPIHSNDTIHIIQNPNVKLRTNVLETPRPYLNLS